MKRLDLDRSVLVRFVAAALLSGCGASQPPMAAPGFQAPAIDSVRQEVVAPAVVDPRRTLVMTREIGGLEPDLDRVVKVREFKVPAHQIATDSIIVGPDRNLWFAEWCAIARLTVRGQFRVTKVLTNSAPGLLTIGPDGNIWANPAGDYICSSRKEPLTIEPHVLFRVTPDGQLTIFRLPLNNDVFPTALLNINSTLYFGLPVLGLKHGSEVLENFLATISTRDGIVKKIALIPPSQGTGDGYVMGLRTPGPKIWFYDFAGNLHICSTAGKCFVRKSGYPFKFVDNLFGTVMAYSPADQDVYIENQNTYTIIRFGLGGTRLRGYRNHAFAFGFGIIAYYHGDIWVALGGDSKARPNIGRLTPSGEFSEISLPFTGPTAAVTALVGGPDGHLWYLRGYHVGEILSKV